MKYSFDLTRHRRVNVWLDEVPPADFNALYTVTRILKAGKVVTAPRRIAALEIKIPRGPMDSYAFLGAELAALALDGLEVVVPVNGMGSRYTSSLVSRLDDVRVGVTEEYVEAVFAGVQKAGDLIGLPMGASLKFRWAAHGAVGSSPSIFETASSLVLRLLLSSKEDSESQIAALF